MKLVVDIYGGDFSPNEQLKGCVIAMEKAPDMNLVLSGKADEMKQVLQTLGADMARIELLDAAEVITNDDAPTLAIRAKKNSSLVRALDYLKDDGSAMGLLSSGSTGAVLTGGILKLGRAESVMRPSLIPVLPTQKRGRFVVISDCGANVDCKPEYLVQFALMGNAYAKAYLGVENPRVGLLSVGVEDGKGNELTKEVFGLLKQLPINFVGNMEAREALSGEYDVIVADGFCGNVLLKAVEGASKTVLTCFKEEVMESKSAKVGALFMKKALKNLKTRMDYTTMGGACFLGLNKLVVKAHGSTKDIAFAACLTQLKRMAENDLLSSVGRELAKYKVVSAE